MVVGLQWVHSLYARTAGLGAWCDFSNFSSFHSYDLTTCWCLSHLHVHVKNHITFQHDQIKIPFPCSSLNNAHAWWYGTVNNTLHC